MSNRKLSPQEAAFCRYYILDCDRDAKSAAIKAGYADGSAKQSGYRLLQRPHIKEEIARLEADALRRSGVVISLMTAADQTADRTVPTVVGSIASQIREETDVNIIAALARASILAIVFENLEICVGRRQRKITVKPKKADDPTTVEVYDPNPSAANQAAQILLAAPEISGKGNEAATPEDARIALREALKEFDR